MYYLLVFALNAKFDPVVLTDCVEYKDAPTALIKTLVDDLSKTSKCEKSHDAISWTCIEPKSRIITKAVVMKDKAECNKFPRTASKNMKKLFGK